jgi:hypothetical protein
VFVSVTHASGYSGLPVVSPSSLTLIDFPFNYRDSVLVIVALYVIEFGFPPAVYHFIHRNNFTECPFNKDFFRFTSFVNIIFLFKIQSGA